MSKLLATWILITTVCGPACADDLRLIRYTDLWANSPARVADAAGLTYVPERGRLVLSDSEISEYGSATDPATGLPIYQGANIFELSLDATTVSNRWLAVPTDPSRTEPVGIAFHPHDRHMYIVDDDEQRILRYQFDADAAFGAPLASMRTSVSGAYTDPEGVAVDPRTGDLLVASGTKNERVLRFRFDEAANEFALVNEFAVGDWIRDPEGIAIHPQSGHVFLIAVSGIAEFTSDGVFQQTFDYAEMDGTDITLKLPGGGVFAPSSNVHDSPTQLSLYVTCRGIDNGAFPERNSLDGGLAEFALVRQPQLSDVVTVPDDFATIPAAIAAVSDGATILVKPGVYKGAIDFGQKRIRLVSGSYFDGNPRTVYQTILDGQGGDYVLQINAADAADLSRTSEEDSSQTLIYGFTIRNADDGITATRPFDLSHCYVTNTSDGIDYEAGGGTVRHCRFEFNRDDAIDLDGPTAALIEQCHLINNRDDGVEIRLQPHTAETPLQIVIRDNLIAGNGEDGIQLIGYATPTSRSFRIESNRILDNAMCGVGLMDNANTREDYEAAPLPETIRITNNTFSGHVMHITGGACMLVANNLLLTASRTALKGQTQRSLVIHNLIWREGEASQPDVPMSQILRQPISFVNQDCELEPNSPAVDAGVSTVDWLDETWTIVPPAEFRGAAPDLGARER